MDRKQIGCEDARWVELAQERGPVGFGFSGAQHFAFFYESKFYHRLIFIL
jgi:hypothetical protein